jgi:hypothetical protein
MGCYMITMDSTGHVLETPLVPYYRAGRVRVRGHVFTIVLRARSLCSALIGAHRFKERMLLLGVLKP